MIALQSSASDESLQKQHQLLQQQVHELLLLDQSADSHAQVADLTHALLLQAGAYANDHATSQTSSALALPSNASQLALQGILGASAETNALLPFSPPTISNTLTRAYEETKGQRVPATALVPSDRWVPSGSVAPYNPALAPSTAVLLAADPEATAKVQQVHAQLAYLHDSLRSFKRERMGQVVGLRELLPEASSQSGEWGQQLLQYQPRQLPPPSQPTTAAALVSAMQLPLPSHRSYSSVSMPFTQQQTQPSRASISVLNSPASSMRTSVGIAANAVQPSSQPFGPSAPRFNYATPSVPASQATLPVPSPGQITLWPSRTEELSPLTDARSMQPHQPPTHQQQSSSLEHQLLQWQLAQQINPLVTPTNAAHSMQRSATPTGGHQEYSPLKRQQPILPQPQSSYVPGAFGRQPFDSGSSATWYDPPPPSVSLTEDQQRYLRQLLASQR